MHRHFQEDSKLEEMSLTMIPYWIVSTSARTSIVASDVAAEAGQIATTVALAGLMGAALGGGRGRGGGFGGGFGGPMVTGAVLGGTMGAGRGNVKKTQELDNNYNFPIVALKAFTQYQPRDYAFALEERTFFDMAKVPKDVQIMNGDIGEEVARYQAKTLVDQLSRTKPMPSFTLCNNCKPRSTFRRPNCFMLQSGSHAMIMRGRRSYWSSMEIRAVINSIGLT